MIKNLDYRVIVSSKIWASANLFKPVWRSAKFAQYICLSLHKCICLNTQCKQNFAQTLYKLAHFLSRKCLNFICPTTKFIFAKKKRSLLKFRSIFLVNSEGLCLKIANQRSHFSCDQVYAQE